MKYGLIGKTLKHSYSKELFTKWFKELMIEASFNLYELEEIDALPLLLQRNPDIKGLSVTIPYKIEVKNFCDVIDESAIQCGAINCIKITQGKLTGYNTDRFGFTESLTRWLNHDIPNAIILGTGGAARAASSAFDQLGVNWIMVSRNPTTKTIGYDKITQELLSKYPLIINATPLGMYPNIESIPPLPLSLLTKNNMFFDMTYNPPETLFLQYAKGLKAKHQNGLVMLEEQAKRSWDIWNS